VKSIPLQPFTTADFSPQGGGIDFLGLRWVSLTIVGRDLVPQLNNVTQDMGLFALGAWIPWKFRELCRSGRDYTEPKYKAFREKVEVATSMTYRGEANLPRTHGVVRRQLGSTQKVTADQRLTFKAANRGEQNTLYAAANYGPALQALGLIQTYRSRAEGGAPLRIPVVSEDADTSEIVSAVDRSLRASRQYGLLDSLDIASANWRTIHDLGNAGLDPAIYRAKSFKNLKTSFRKKLLPPDAHELGYRRTLTARLIVDTLSNREPMSGWELRNAWYLGRYSNNRPLRISAAKLCDQARRWSCLMARQYQRFPLEVLLSCFEQALAVGSRSVDEVIRYWRRRSLTFNNICERKLSKFLHDIARSVGAANDIEKSRLWNANVSADDQRFEHIPEPLDDDAIEHALQMIAGWYWRALVRDHDPDQSELMELGGPDRIAMRWFIQWLRTRLDCTVLEVVRDFFSDLVFAQHMRVALARFDGTSQRLRFALSDNGIEPTLSARRDLGKLRLPWMPDRLDSLVGLLCDCDVLKANGELLSLGPAADDVIVASERS
jgi:hypothetical protein